MGRKNIALAAFVVLATLFAGICLLGIPKRPEAISGPSAAMAGTNRNQLEADRVVGNILYIRDTRPHGDLCYAYYWSNLSNGGPALADVPCAAIPTELLVTANVSR